MTVSVVAVAAVVVAFVKLEVAVAATRLVLGSVFSVSEEVMTVVLAVVVVFKLANMDVLTGITVARAVIVVV